ncbi:MAG: hypothetical protein QM662_00095 [Gordonia sp. (in: high G+C Gram-positive bacteria)]
MDEEQVLIPDDIGERMTRGIPAGARWAMVFAVICGAVLGALIAFAATPHSTHYRAEAKVALLPKPNLPIAESANFWEVLSSGQISKTAATVYQDADRWLAPAAQAAGVPQSDLSLAAAEVPGTCIVKVTVEGPTKEAASTALNNVLGTANPQVTAVSAPFVINVMDAGADSVREVTGVSGPQIIAAGFLAGAIVGAGAGLLLLRWRRRRSEPSTSDTSGDTVDASSTKR